MAEKKKVQAVITSQIQVSEGIYSMWLKFPQNYNVAAMARPGQFISLYCSEGSRLLPRPISICEILAEEAMLRIVYRVAGEGTREFSGRTEGDKIEVVGPLGNGFEQREGSALLIGGGIGIPPMLELAKTLHHKGQDVKVVLGYRDNDLFLASDFEAYGQVYFSTEDGSVGTHGNVIDAIREQNISADAIYSCGPIPMLRGVKQYGLEQGIATQISMEEKMACGIGACLACVCRTKEIDGHSHVHNTRICKDGPVFYAQDIEL